MDARDRGELFEGVTPTAIACLPGVRVPHNPDSPRADAAVEVAIARMSSAGVVGAMRDKNCSSFHIERSGLETRPSVPSATGVPCSRSRSHGCGG